MPQASHVNQTVGSQSAGTSFNVTRPTGGDVSGRYIMVVMASDVGVVGDMTHAAGGGAAWTVGMSHTMSNDSLKVRVFWKFANGSEPSTYAGTKNSGADCAWTAVVVQDVDTGSTPTISTPSGIYSVAATATTIPTPGNSGFGSDDFEYRFGIANPNANTRTITSYAATTPTLTLLTGIQSTSYTMMRGAYRALTSAGATSDVNATFSATTVNRVGLSVRLKSASAPATEVSLGWASEEDASYVLTSTIGLNANLGWASEEDASYAFDAQITIPIDAYLDIAIEQDLANTPTHTGGQPPPPPPPPPPRDTRDPRMPYVQCEIGFVTDASVQGYLVLDDSERGKLDVGKLAPGGGASIGGEIYEDVSAYLSAVTTRQGATRVESPLIRYEAGEAQVTLRNEDRRFDPTNLDGPYVTGSGSTATGTESFTSTKGLPRAWGVTIGIRSHATTGPATLRAVEATTSQGVSGTVNKPSGTVQNDYLTAINNRDWGVAVEKFRAVQFGSSVGRSNVSSIPRGILRRTWM